MEPKNEGYIVRGIRWITGIPISYYFYEFLVWLNLQVVTFLYDKLTFIPYFIWESEYLFANGLVSIYLVFFFMYLYLPRDGFALINNTKVKVIYWIMSAWSVIQLITMGVLIADAAKHYVIGMIYQILYTPTMLIMMWSMYRIIVNIDYNHNQGARDYLEQLKYQEYLDTLDVLEENEKQTAISN